MLSDLHLPFGVDEARMSDAPSPQFRWPALRTLKYTGSWDQVGMPLPLKQRLGRAMHLVVFSPTFYLDAETLNVPSWSPDLLNHYCCTHPEELFEVVSETNPIALSLSFDLQAQHTPDPSPRLMFWTEMSRLRSLDLSISAEDYAFVQTTLQCQLPVVLTVLPLVHLGLEMPLMPWFLPDYLFHLDELRGTEDILAQELARAGALSAVAEELPRAIPSLRVLMVTPCRSSLPTARDLEGIRSMSPGERRSEATKEIRQRTTVGGRNTRWCWIERGSGSVPRVVFIGTDSGEHDEVESGCTREAEGGGPCVCHW
ncbi:uncharacterized protein BXZ73DRAFT_75582 [Epithele typhae]|uniref:uncharacterized protein n=1 Tax=Epithele typhae TaxID=378194 RepID=UPI0020089B58|nr:uncharacterized protein BXZ73DRAFT_75582 [Epithele typhae]KAH9940500.1 hypothetical protein BXZ73DRAFT_75582 [Epithele typhae]